MPTAYRLGIDLHHRLESATSCPIPKPMVPYPRGSFQCTFGYYSDFSDYAIGVCGNTLNPNVSHPPLDALVP